MLKKIKEDDVNVPTFNEVILKKHFCLREIEPTC